MSETPPPSSLDEPRSQADIEPATPAQSLWQRLIHRAQTPFGIVSILQSIVIVILLVVLVVQGLRLNRLSEQQAQLATQLQDLSKGSDERHIESQAQLKALEFKLNNQSLALSDPGSFLASDPNAAAQAQTKYRLLLAQIDTALADLGKVRWASEQGKPRLQKLSETGEAKKTQAKQDKKNKSASTPDTETVLKAKLLAAGGWGSSLWTGLKEHLQNYLGDLVRIQSIPSVQGAQLSLEQLALARSEIEQLLYFSRWALLVGKPDLALHNLQLAHRQAQRILLSRDKQQAKSLEGIARAESLLRQHIRAAGN